MDATTRIPHILVVDDEPDIAELFRQKFRREIRAGELRFSFASNGSEGLKVIQDDPEITVVFTDLNMPVMNGLDLLARLRALQGRVLRSVVVSAYGDMANIRTAMNQGALDFIIKPIDMQDLDLTLRKAITEVQGMLAAREAERDLHSTRLEKEAADQARRAQKEFFDNVTHELRTPLTLLLGPLENALDHTQESETRQWLQLAHRNGRQLLSLIDELLDTARIGAGAMRLEAVPGDLVAFVRALGDTFAPLSRSRGIAFATDIPDQALNTQFDPPKLRKVIGNLMGNALKYTPEGGSVMLRLSVPAPQMAVITVEDNGPGIAPEDLERIFDRFYRAHGSQGTGIGLSLARSLAELHGGRLEATSALGKGATFVLRLPLVEVAEPMSLPLPDTEEESSAPLVLIVEDHPEMRAHVRACLGPEYHVLEAADGQAGLALARTHIPDIVVSDVMMPVMDGLALTSALRADPATSHIPVILLTAKAASENRLEGLEGGADIYLSKPFHKEELRLHLRNLLRRREELRARLRKEVLTQPHVEAQPSMDEQFLRKVHALLTRELANERFGVEQLADELGMSRKTLHRKLSALTGQAPNPFIRAFRLEAAMQMLKNKIGPVGEVAYLTGFGSHSYFSKCFVEYFHVSPSEV